MPITALTSDVDMGLAAPGLKVPRGWIQNALNSLLYSSNICCQFAELRGFRYIKSATCCPSCTRTLFSSASETGDLPRNSFISAADQAITVGVDGFAGALVLSGSVDSTFGML